MSLIVAKCRNCQNTKLLDQEGCCVICGLISDPKLLQDNEFITCMVDREINKPCHKSFKIDDFYRSFREHLERQHGLKITEKNKLYASSQIKQLIVKYNQIIDKRRLFDSNHFICAKCFIKKVPLIPILNYEYDWESGWSFEYDEKWCITCLLENTRELDD